jgi:hypothetical protein
VRSDIWKGVLQDIQDYISGCVVCQKTKHNAGQQSNLLNPLLVTDELWEAICWDLIGPLPESQGFNTIMTIVDTKMKGIKLELSSMMLSTMGMARIMQDRVY